MQGVKHEAKTGPSTWRAQVQSNRVKIWTKERMKREESEGELAQ